MKKTFFAAVICLAAVAACNSNSSNPTTEAKDANAKMADSTNAGADMKADNDFAVNAGNGGMTEVALSKLATTNAQSPAVKSLAEMMIMDHTKANDQLKALAQKNNIVLADSLSTDSQKAVNDMKGKKGKDFDKAFVDKMESDHKSTIDMFQNEANNGKNPDLKNFAATTLPALQKHLTMVDSTQKNMK